MNKKKVLIITAIILILIPCLIFAFDSSVCFFNDLIVSAELDFSDWKLSNEKYKICPVVNDNSITFYVEDKDGNVVFEAPQSWRTWDFKSINIDDDNIIIADSGDIGSSIYAEDGNGSYIKVE